MTRLAFVALLVACGDHHAAPPDAPDMMPDAGFATAAHTPFPAVLPHNHSILDHVALVTITYADYPDRAMVDAFGDAVVASSYYTMVGAEYGLSAGTHQSVHLTQNAPSTLKDTDIDTLMKQLVTNHTVPTTAGTQYLYMIYIPHSVTLDASLMGFYGYHTDTTAGQTRFAYAVVLDDGTGIDTTTVTASHELVEGATDPYFKTNPNGDGWYTDPPLPDPWYLIEGEVADLCNDEPFEHVGTFAVQRIWSNTAAQAGMLPCLPNEGEPWMDVSAAPATMPTIPKGGSAMFTLTGWSTADAPPWNLATYTADFSDLMKSEMAVQLSGQTIGNGTTVTVTLHAPNTATSGQLGGIYVSSGPNFHPWVVGFVVQ